MEHLQIRIQGLGDQVALIHDGATPRDVIQTKDVIVGLQEAATVGGQTGVSFAAKIPGGKVVWFQITANNFEALIGAYKGAQERFNQPVNYPNHE